MNSKVRYILASITCLMVFFMFTPSQAFPLGIKKEKYHSPPKVKNYKLLYGNIKNFLVYIYTGSEFPYEIELQIFFKNKKPVRVLIIYGPHGIDNHNYGNLFRNIRTTLIKKYGHFTYIRETRDPILDDLVSQSRYLHLKLGALRTEMFWKKRALDISLTLLGDEEGVYIEIEYRSQHLSRNPELNKLLKSLRKRKNLKSLRTRQKDAFN